LLAGFKKLMRGMGKDKCGSLKKMLNSGGFRNPTIIEQILRILCQKEAKLQKL